MPIPAYLWHPVFVHFSVALLSVATAFYVLASLFPDARLRRQWITVAEWNLWVGFGFAVLTVLFGWLAYDTVDHDDQSHAVMQTHAVLALTTAAGFALLTLGSIWHRKDGSYPAWLFTGPMVVCFGLLLLTGLRGGELVYKHGLAVDAAGPVSVPVSPTAPAPEQQTGQPPESESNAPGHRHEHHHRNERVESSR